MEIKSLTSLRGFFACWVMLHHIRDFAPGGPFRDFHGLLHRGYVAVDFFFILSGFILASSYGKRFLTGADFRNYIGFVGRRWGRMFPLHIAVMLAMIAAWHYPLGYWRTLVEFGLMQRWPGIPTWMVHDVNGPSWSISTEWAVNLAFPLFIWLCLSSSRKYAIAAATIFIAALTLLAARNHWSLDIFGTDALPLIRCVAGFGLGVLAFRWRNAPWLASDAALSGLAAAYAVGLLLNAGDLFLMAVAGLAIVGLGSNRGRASRVLSVRPLHWLGEVSFSIYLVHFPIICGMAELIGPTRDPLILTGYAIVTAITVLIVSAFTYRFIEVWARDKTYRLIDLIIKDRHQAARPTVAAAAS